MKVILYSNQISPRLSYIIDFFSALISGEPIFITTNIDEFKNADAVKINYSPTKIDEAGLNVIPHSLLFEEGIRLQFTECFDWNEIKVFFRSGGDIPFDIFAASF